MINKNGTKSCNNCHRPTDVEHGPWPDILACSEACGRDLDDMLDAPGDKEYVDEIRARGRNVDCDHTNLCRHCSYRPIRWYEYPYAIVTLALYLSFKAYSWLDDKMRKDGV